MTSIADIKVSLYSSQVDVPVYILHRLMQQLTGKLCLSFAIVSSEIENQDQCH